MKADTLFRNAVGHFVRIGGRVTFPVLCNHTFVFSSKLGQWE
jgi:hypothetical protein